MPKIYSLWRRTPRDCDVRRTKTKSQSTEKTPSSNPKSYATMFGRKTQLKGIEKYEFSHKEKIQQDLDGGKGVDRKMWLLRGVSRARILDGNVYQREAHRLALMRSKLKMRYELQKTTSNTRYGKFPVEITSNVVSRPSGYNFKCRRETAITFTFYDSAWYRRRARPCSVRLSKRWKTKIVKNAVITLNEMDVPL